MGHEDGKFLHRLERSERRDTGEAVPDFNRAVARPGGDQLDQFLGTAEILGVVNLGGARFVERRELSDRSYFLRSTNKMSRS
jgi:hypothetical protein